MAFSEAARSFGLDPLLAATGSAEISAKSSHPDDFSREIYGIFGIAVDAVDMAALTQRIRVAAASRSPFLLSTPNLNFLVTSQTDPDFRESLLQSDLCPPDGMPIIWIARLLGIPLQNRIAGSDLFEALKTQSSPSGTVRPLSVFFFGGPPGIAVTAAQKLAAEDGGLTAAGAHFPGYGSVQEMSGEAVIETVNASQADILVVSLGSAKGQAWLMHNHHRIRIPVRSHLGATINFQAGTIVRAPKFVRRWGLEWLWRIKEEPHLWRRYWKDGHAFLRLLLTRILPVAVMSRWHAIKSGKSSNLRVTRELRPGATVLRFAGAADRRSIDIALPAFREAAQSKADVVIDLSGVRFIDSRFLGALLLLRKHLLIRNRRLAVVAGLRIARAIRLHGFKFLLTPSSENTP